MWDGHKTDSTLHFEKNVEKNVMNMIVCFIKIHVQQSCNLNKPTFQQWSQNMQQ